MIFVYDALAIVVGFIAFHFLDYVEATLPNPNKKVEVHPGEVRVHRGVSLSPFIPSLHTLPKDIERRLVCHIAHPPRTALLP
jgi:hypothetical protein